MSKLQVDDIVNKDDNGGVGFSKGAVVTGVMTATSFSGGASGDFSVEDKIVHTGDTNTSIRFPEADTFTVETAGSERVRVTSGGQVRIGSSGAPSNKNTVTPLAHVDGSGVNGALQVNRHTSVGGGGSQLILSATRGSSITGHTILQDDDGIGTIEFSGSDGGEFVTGARIQAAVDGTPGDDDLPGRLSFFTTADGASVVTERMRIHNGGVVSFNNGIELGSGLDATEDNILDDYEEGTWTPSIGGNATYTTQAGNYVKVGTMVLAHFRLNINTKGTGSTIGAISGLPFASTKASQNTSALTWGSLNTNIIYGVYYVGSGSQTLNFSYASSAASSMTNNPDLFQDGSTINGTIMYIA